MSTTKTSNAPPTTTYSPEGCNKPVMTHLTATERDQVSQLAKSELRSMSATVRMFVIEGLQRHANALE